jgi:hypothetical protein
MPSAHGLDRTMKYVCSVNGNEYISLEMARTAREAAKRCAWGYIRGQEQKLEYTVNVKVDERDFRVRIGIYPHFDIHEYGVKDYLIPWVGDII